MNTDLDIASKVLKTGCGEIKFCQLTELEYTSIYYEQMKKVGWKPIADAMTAHYILAQNSIFALKHNSTVIATLSAAKCPVFGVAYMGFFIVDKEWRGLGLGKHLWKKTASLLKQEGYAIEFDSPVDLLSYYSDLGYTVLMTATMYMLKDQRHINASAINANIQDINRNNIADVIKYDRSIINNSNRKAYLSAWINKKHTMAVCYISNGNVRGYGIMSKHIANNSSNHTDSYVLAPIYAQNSEVAIEIIRALCSRANANEPIYLDTLNFDPAPAAAVRSLGFEEIMPINRMSDSGSLGDERELVISQIYALSSHGYSPL
ncbi:MAG: N-acetyltransferase, family [Gammaproteobacteria bacterium]|jgi:GNAT superfamily N-acetyltransferase|nr:N-acetyltransferase, family [Gammaproteobacteria bacterium]